MDNPLLNIGNDNLTDISKKLKESHLVYLETDESPLKLQQRKKLEGYIKEFLCLVPHGHKYVFHETADILHRSAQTMKDFSGYRACTAWSAISLYAANLLAQPWRKEYRTLRTYSGYYKHEVETNLIGAELMFELMGYKHIDLEVMQLEDPIDPDKVSSVSRDSIVAFVECQILKQIWEAVSKKFQISWLEVLQFRENHVCTPEQAIRALNQRFLEKLNRGHHGIGYCQNQSMMINSMGQGLSYDLAMNNVPSSQNGYRHLDDPAAMHFYHVNYDKNYTPYSYLPHSMKYTSNLSYATPPIPTPCVPTGRLIELDTPGQDKIYNGKSYSRSLEYDELDTCKSDGLDYSTVEKKPSTFHERSVWDYVFQNLDNQDYKKDLGNREDVLQQTSHKHTNEKLHVRTYEKKKDKNYAEKRKTGESQHVLKDFEMESGYGQELRKKVPSNVKSTSSGITDVLESVKSMLVIEESQKNEDANKWNCASCTYLNAPKKEICEMCNKSKHKGNEDVPLASGSKECPKCTLINEKDAKICAACDNSLKDSPTYI